MQRCYAEVLCRGVVQGSCAGVLCSGVVQWFCAGVLSRGVVQGCSTAVFDSGVVQGCLPEVLCRGVVRACCACVLPRGVVQGCCARLLCVRILRACCTFSKTVPCASFILYIHSIGVELFTKARHRFSWTDPGTQKRAKSLQNAFCGRQNVAPAGSVLSFSPKRDTDSRGLIQAPRNGQNHCKTPSAAARMLLQLDQR